MEVKTFEIRDRHTFVPCYGWRVYFTRTRDIYLAHLRAGYPESGSEIVFGRLDYPAKSQSDPFEWGDRTFQVAHNYIRENWANLESGAVIDVEFILGETPRPKISELHDESLDAESSAARLTRELFRPLK